MTPLDVSLAMSVHGEMGEHACLWLASRASPCSRIIEVGSLHGRSALAMLANSSAHLWCVDVWGEPSITTDADHIEFIKNISPYLDRVSILRMHSHLGAVELLNDYGENSFDMVFIDGGHDYDTVRGDILGYRPLLREGGLLSGHDYSHRMGHPGVKKAVNELLGIPNRGAGSIWWVEV
jgi:predicted O-methyltransferase YrrM